MKIYVISLKTAEERRKQISEQLNNLKLDFEFLDAINTIDNSTQIDHVIKIKKVFPMTRAEFSRVEVACSLSHQEVAHKFLQSNEDVCLILEDDAEVDSEIHDLINYVKLIHQDFDTILLGYCKLKKSAYEKFYSREPIFNVAHSVKGFNLGKVGKNWTSGAVGYFLTKSGAQKLKVNLEKYSTLADQWDIFERDFGLEILHCRPLVVHEKFQSFKSSLEEVRSKNIKTAKPTLSEYISVLAKIILIKVHLYYPACRLLLKLTKHG
jgi:glycosyl transferase family 25